MFEKLDFQERGNAMATMTPEDSMAAFALLEERAAVLAAMTPEARAALLRL